MNQNSRPSKQQLPILGVVPWGLMGLLGLTWLLLAYTSGIWPILPLDFSLFWGAGLRVAEGQAHLVYDGPINDVFLGGLHNAEPPQGLNFPYPPGLLLFLWPLSFFSFTMAWGVFLLFGMAAFFGIARHFTNSVVAFCMVIALGGPIHSVALGQNGFYTAALIAGGCLLLRKSKPLAGIALGLLVLKPHLAVVAVMALIWWREWRALAWLAGTTLVLVLAPTLIFGPVIWDAFLSGNTSFIDTISQKQHTLIEPMQQTVLAGTIGKVGLIGGLIAQASIGIVALGACFSIKNRDLAIPAVIAATLLVTPFSFLYDSTMLVLACAMLIRYDARLSWPLAGLIAYTGLWFWTLYSHVPMSAFAVLAIAWYLDRREQNSQLSSNVPVG